ncbi:MAG: CPBP family intramembrane metalloprotease [Clostridium sp.]|nr:CPBP family intramembrane metalloprotease [Clostridium sp.]MBP3214850.1 CPBP family intramembrane metalloprotease [Clostridium sp.]
MMHRISQGFYWALRFFWPLVFYDLLAGAAGKIFGRDCVWLALFGAAFVAIPVLYAVWRYRQNRGRRAGIREILTAFAEGMVLGVILNLLMAACGLAEYSGSYEKAAEYMFAMPLALQLLGMCILAPLAEELLFRGLAYTQLRETCPMWAAAVLSALYFGAAHGNIAQGIYGFLVGLCLAKSYEDKGLAGAVAMHMGANTGAVLLQLFFTA